MEWSGSPVLSWSPHCYSASHRCQQLVSWLLSYDLELTMCFLSLYSTNKTPQTEPMKRLLRFEQKRRPRARLSTLDSGRSRWRWSPWKEPFSRRYTEGTWADDLRDTWFSSVAMASLSWIGMKEKCHVFSWVLGSSCPGKWLRWTQTRQTVNSQASEWEPSPGSRREEIALTSSGDQTLLRLQGYLFFFLSFWFLCNTWSRLPPWLQLCPPRDLGNIWRCI